MKKILSSMLAGFLCLTTFTACNDDDFTESIYNTDVPAVDTTLATAPFDQWLFDNFVTPYNVEIIYRFSLPSSDLTYQLTPAEYKKSQLLAQLVRHLFYDVYTQMAGPDFMKQYGPRLFHFIGSVGYNATTGTEVLGTASGGIKITLYNVNALNSSASWSEGDIQTVNEYYFHTMHHEFSHILHQTKPYPVTFGQITNSIYDPLNWQKRDSVDTHDLGCVTNYASSANKEDFVETLSCIITDSDRRWMTRIIDGCLNGVRAGDKETILTLIDSLNVDLDDPTACWNNFTLYEEYNNSADDTSFSRYVPDYYARGAGFSGVNSTVDDKAYTYTLYRHFTSFKDDFLPWVKIVQADDIKGMNAMLKKIEIATTWYTTNWKLYVYALRQDVRERQDDINTYLRDSLVIYDYK